MVTRPASPVACLHMSNLLTYGSLLTGMGAIRMALHGDRGATGALIAVAVLADTFDGRFARLFPRGEAERAFGVQLDSLSDAVVLGAAPPVCCALLAPAAADTWIWWLAAFVYGACAITRLGFYNLSSDQTGFVGLPVPAAALIASTALAAGAPGPTLLVAVIAAGTLMIAPIRIPRPVGAWLALFALWPIALVFVHTAARR